MTPDVAVGGIETAVLPKGDVSLPVPSAAALAQSVREGFLPKVQDPVLEEIEEQIVSLTGKISAPR